VLVVVEALAGIANRRQQLPVLYIGENPGMVNLGVVQRLDAPVAADSVGQAGGAGLGGGVRLVMA
jgi:hypothetical protein